MRKKIMISIVCFIFSALFIFSNSASAEIEKPFQLRIATTGIGGNWYLYGQGIGDIFKKVLPDEYKVEVLPRAGGLANPKLVHKGDAEVCLSLSVNSSWAYTGTVAYSEPQSKIRSLLGGLDIFFMGILANEKSGVNSLEEIKTGENPFRLITTPVGGLGEYGARQIMEANETPYNWLKSNGGFARHIARVGTVDYLREKKADAWSHIISPGFPLVTQIAAVVPVKLLPLSEDVVEKLKVNGWKKYEIPVGTFDFIKKPVLSVATSTTVLVSEDMSDELAYKLTKALIENKNELVKVHAALKNFKPEDGCWKLDATGAPLHPGAEKYFREKGWLK
jgi:TRAP transporter TAXI family solute receptor